MITMNPIARLLNIGPAKDLSQVTTVKGVAGDISYRLWCGCDLLNEHGEFIKVNRVTGILANKNILSRQIDIILPVDRKYIELTLTGIVSGPIPHDYYRVIRNPDGIPDETLCHLLDQTLDQMGLNANVTDHPVGELVPLTKHSFIELDEDRPDPSTDYRHGYIKGELTDSLLRIIWNVAKNSDYAKLARHGYDNICIRTDVKTGASLGLRYTKDGVDTVVTESQLAGYSQRVSGIIFGLRYPIRCHTVWDITKAMKMGVNVA